MKKIDNSNKNKQIVLEFYKEVIGNKDTVFAQKTLIPTYIQHNPQVKTGIAGMLEALEMLKQLPPPDKPARPHMRLIAQAELVVIHLNIEFAGQQKAVLDLFRFENGRIAEHWDAIQDITSLGSESITAVDGPIDIEDLHLTDQNATIIRNFSQQVLVNKCFDKLSDFVAEKLIQHTPEVKDGIESFQQYLAGLAFEQVYRIVSEGNFVVSQSSGIAQGLPYVFYNVYRLSDRKIQEYWSVAQAIPEIMAHENGMI